MGNLIFALALIGLVVEIIAYCLGRKSIFGEGRAAEKIVTDEDSRLAFDSRKAAELTGTLIEHLNIASDSLHNANLSREAAESSIRHIEMLLVEQDKLGFVTSGSELDVLLRSQILDRDEESFIKSQQNVHAHVEKMRDCLFEMQRLSASITEWRRDKDSDLQDSCDKLISDLEGKAHQHWALTKRMLSEVDRDPVGIDDDRVTPRVLAFRKELQQLRSHIRTKLAAKT